MTATLRHQVQDDGRVIICATNGIAQSVHVTASEAKRFAWSILNDLSPEEVFEEREAKQPRPEAPVSQPMLILQLLCKGPHATPDIAWRLGTSRNQAAVLMNGLKRLDYARILSRSVIHGMGAGRSPNVWEITDAGRLHVSNFARITAERVNSSELLAHADGRTLAG